MTPIEMAVKMSLLVRADIDAAHAYGQLAAMTDAGTIMGRLVGFRKDHERHINQLSAVIRALDFDPPEYNSDSMGLLVEGFAPVPAMGMEGALHVMKANEERINQIYHETSALDFTPNIKELVACNYRDEQFHLRFIQEVLDKKSWAR